MAPRAALRTHRTEPALGDGPFAWLSAPDGVLAFTRGTDNDFVCVVNLSTSPIILPAHRAVILASGPLTNGQLPPDTAVWLRR